jgi:indolepyruvate ferredoxin oxidoreductase
MTERSTHVEPRLRSYALRDHYSLDSGSVTLTGIQALVRLPLDIHRSDRRRGYRTATFISGYEGSPLGGYDLALLRERELLDEHDVVLVPGVNEELAATAVWGSQQPGLGTLDRHDGVVGIWYGKSPGVDRAGDAFRHANTMGVHPRGGVIVLAGDDPGAKSSTIPSSSEWALADARMAVLAPRSPQDVLDLGLHALAMSRYSGLWVAMKIVTSVADGFGTVEVGPARVQPHLPALEFDGRPWQYQQGAIPLGQLDEEADLVEHRTPAAQAYANHNRIDEVVAPAPNARFGIIASGACAREVDEALTQLHAVVPGLSPSDIRVLALRMLHPIDAGTVRSFVRGLETLLVVEEKRPFVEDQVRNVLYGASAAPRVLGKRDAEGRTLIPSYGSVVVSHVVAAVVAVLGVETPAPRARIPIALSSETERETHRVPYFCSGCPHNRSTLVPEGSVAAAGIGCHTMTALMGRSAVSIPQMGGEGAEWIGRAPFTDRRHIFQNVGDGTFFHSGSMAVRACVAAGVSITFKILYNGAVAMTGGQEPTGVLAVPELTRLLEAEGVGRIIVCAEDPGRFPKRARWAKNVRVWPRTLLDEAQRELREEPGVTVLIHDQMCAAEKRRDRKRGILPAATQRVVVNPRVCEGCGDCIAKSNCLSVHRVATEFGEKIRIHQSSCNQDLTCLEGDCPALVTVTVGAKQETTLQPRGLGNVPADIPEPARPEVDGAYSVYLVGIGGTGVVTASQVLATAGHLDGLYVTGLDQTGLSQKAGPVVSHVRFGREWLAGSNAIGPGRADALLAFDALTAAEPVHAERLAPSTRIVVSTSVVPTGQMTNDRDVQFPEPSDLVARLGRRSTRSPVALDAIRAAEALFGDHMFANVVLLGAAYQAGLLPTSSAAIEQALTLNGSAVDANVAAFRCGRLAVADPDSFAATIDRADATSSTRRQRRSDAAVTLLSGTALSGELRRLVEVRVGDLIDYQSTAVARRYLDFVLRVAEAESERMPGSTALVEAVAVYLYKLTAYKDEYEVARLHLLPDLDELVAADVPHGARVRFHLHPPVLRAMGWQTKIAFGRSARPTFRFLRAMRRVRGTPFDVFGYSRMRKMERSLINEYRVLIDTVLEQLDETTAADALAAARLPEAIRGYEAIKIAAVEEFRSAARLAMGDREFEAAHARPRDRSSSPSSSPPS